MNARMTLINKPSRQEDSTWEHQNNSLESPPSPLSMGQLLHISSKNKSDTDINT